MKPGVCAFSFAKKKQLLSRREQFLYGFFMVCKFAHLSCVLYVWLSWAYSHNGYFRLACSISMRRVWVGALPLQCLWYRYSSPLLASEWISGIRFSSFWNLSYTEKQFIRKTTNVGLQATLCIKILVVEITGVRISHSNVASSFEHLVPASSFWNSNVGYLSQKESLIKSFFL